MNSEKGEKGRVSHEFPPVFDKNSRVLILGTIPSPKSREQGFYYMHPQNRFWKTLCAVLETEIPDTVKARRELCLSRKIALWDVLESCEIAGASDSSIKKEIPNNLKMIFDFCKITAVFTTGKKAHALYKKHFPNFPEDICLPSTSPANRTVSEEEILREYMKIKDYL